MRRALQVLIWAAALTVVACDNNVNFNPTAPIYADLMPFPEQRHRHGW